MGVVIVWGGAGRHRLRYGGIAFQGEGAAAACPVAAHHHGTETEHRGISAGLVRAAVTAFPCRSGHRSVPEPVPGRPLGRRSLCCQHPSEHGVDLAGLRVDIRNGVLEVVMGGKAALRVAIGKTVEDALRMLDRFIDGAAFCLDVTCRDVDRITAAVVEGSDRTGRQLVQGNWAGEACRKVGECAGPIGVKERSAVNSVTLDQCPQVLGKRDLAGCLTGRHRLRLP
jgi:hypothetical protein